METEGQRRLALNKTTPPREQESGPGAGTQRCRRTRSERRTGARWREDPELVVILKRAGRNGRTETKSSGHCFGLKKSMRCVNKICMGCCYLSFVNITETV